MPDDTSLEELSLIMHMAKESVMVDGTPTAKMAMDVSTEARRHVATLLNDIAAKYPQLNGHVILGAVNAMLFRECANGMLAISRGNVGMALRGGVGTYVAVLQMCAADNENPTS